MSQFIPRDRTLKKRLRDAETGPSFICKKTTFKKFLKAKTTLLFRDGYKAMVVSVSDAAEIEPIYRLSL